MAYKYWTALFSLCCALLSSQTSFSVLPSLRLVVTESVNVLAPKGRSMTTSAGLVLRGSKPTKPLSESPFQRVGNLFNRHVQPLDASGELFRRPTVDPELEAFTPTLEHLDKKTVRVNLKKK